MLLAIFSDVHGNLEAFTAVLQDIDENRPDETLCLGDCIGYGPDPERVLEIVRERAIPCVLGNHELGIVDQSRRKWFNPHALKALDRTIAQLSPTSLDMIHDFPRVITRDDIRLVHGCPPDSVFTYLFEPEEEDLVRRMQKTPQTVCFVGHTHDLELVELLHGNLRRRELAPGARILRPDARFICNIGSAGQPRDGDKRAKYALYDTSTRTMELRAVPYDARKTVEKMRALRMPDTYATRLL